MAKKIGIMGGTFNPIHYAHLILAEAAREQFGLDRVLFVPAGMPYLKEGTEILDADERVKLVQLAIEDNTYFKMSRLEVDRPGNTYTIDTLKELSKMYPGDEFYFIMGADSLQYLDKWVAFDEILKLTTVVVANRGELSTSEFEALIDNLKTRYLADIRRLLCPRIDISSSSIRERIKAAKSVRYLMPDTCIDYIKLHGLYTETMSSKIQEDDDMHMA